MQIMGIKSYIKKDIASITALQWRGNYEDLNFFVSDDNWQKFYETGIDVYCGSAGWVDVKDKDYIIKAAENFSVLSEEVFNKTYEHDTRTSKLLDWDE